MVHIDPNPIVEHHEYLDHLNISTPLGDNYEVVSVATLGHVDQPNNDVFTTTIGMIGTTSTLAEMLTFFAQYGYFDDDE